MVKLVLDTNIIVSALIKPQSNPALVISLILQGECRFCLSNEIFEEYEEVLAREKFNRLDQESVKELLSTLKKGALWVVPKVAIGDVAKDEADKRFLECALEAKADFLITGNTQHFLAKKFHRTYILTPSEFITVVTKSIIKRY